MGDLLAILKTYGSGAAGWAVTLMIVAWLFGQGGKLALANIRSLLADSEQLRERLKHALDDCESEIRRRDSVIRDLFAELDQARARIAKLSSDVSRLEAQLR